MSNKLYVTNLSLDVPRDELEHLFAAHGTVRSVAIINPFKTPGCTGTAFVEIDSERHGEAAIAALNGMPHRGSALVVGWAEPGRHAAVDAPRMYGSMNMPEQG